MSQGKGRYLGFIDADGDIPAEQLLSFLDVVREEGPDIVTGSKRHPDADVFYPPLRRLYSWGYQQLIRLLFHLTVRDTQTGIKLIRSDVLRQALPLMVEKRFAFDLELFVVARRLGFHRIVELPVRIERRFTSTISLKAVRGMLIDTLGIFYRLRFLHYYDRSLADLQSIPSLSVPGGVKKATSRILIYNWRDLAHPRAGGAEVYTDAIAREWSAAGHSVTLFTSAVEGFPERERAEGGYEIIRRGSWRSVYGEARRFWRTEGRGQYDLVIDEVNTRPFGCPRWIGDVPVVALIHQVAREIWFHETWLPVALIGRFWLERRWLAAYRDTSTVTVSASSKGSLEAYGLRNVSIVPEGMDILPEQLRPDTLEKESTPTFAFLGRLSSNKRPQHAIEAFGIVRRQFPEARLWIMGTGPMEAELRGRAPDGVEFLGRVSDAEKRDRLGRAHALLVTSVREGWGLVVSEAATVGTPSVGYRVPGLSDSIGVSGGLLTDPKPGALAATLVAEIPHLLAGNYKAAPEGVGTWTQVADQIMAVATGGPSDRHEAWSPNPSEASGADGGRDKVALLRWRGSKTDDNEGAGVDVGELGVPPLGVI
jgi:glycosyltransferase involved in cell wall biosynthesis